MGREHDHEQFPIPQGTTDPHVSFYPNVPDAAHGRHYVTTDGEMFYTLSQASVHARSLHPGYNAHAHAADAAGNAAVRRMLDENEPRSSLTRGIPERMRKADALKRARGR